MSSSFPLFFMPGSERLRLAPNPPRLPSRAHAPERSGIFEEAAGLEFVAAFAGAAVWAGNRELETITAKRTMAEITKDFRILLLLFSPDLALPRYRQGPEYQQGVTWPTDYH